MLGPTYYAAVRSDLRNLNPDLWPLSFELENVTLQFCETIGVFLRFLEL